MTVDIRKSTNMEEQERIDFQKQVFQILDTLVNDYKPMIFSASMTTGDEFQIVINIPSKSYEVYMLIQKKFPDKIYAGLGFGDIEIVENRKKPSEMFGTAFYHARNAIEKAKLKKVDLIFNTGFINFDFELNTLFQLRSFINNKWTKRQNIILTYIGSSDDILQKDAAEHFKISEAAISQMKKTSGYELIIDVDNLINKLLLKFEKNYSSELNVGWLRS